METKGYYRKLKVAKGFPYRPNHLLSPLVTFRNLLFVTSPLATFPPLSMLNGNKGTTFQSLYSTQTNQRPVSFSILRRLLRRISLENSNSNGNIDFTYSSCLSLTYRYLLMYSLSISSLIKSSFKNT